MTFNEKQIGRDLCKKVSFKPFRLFNFFEENILLPATASPKVGLECYIISRVSVSM